MTDALIDWWIDVWFCKLALLYRWYAIWGLIPERTFVPCGC